ncbi:MAG: hypothetical protein HY706_13265 [Candidatus Hydrogenedentes bacterium]|nr:hypothetical protein [Candidatus Hydrogenedentota bacterium]
MMAWIVALVMVFVMGMGIFALAAPSRLPAFVALWQSKTGMWVASLVRVAFGIVLWLAAPDSHTPTILRIVAVVTVVAGAGIPVLGETRFSAFLTWWLHRSSAFHRAWAVAAILGGGFILWSVMW